MLTPAQKSWIDKHIDAQSLMRSLVKNRIPFDKYSEIMQYYSRKQDRLDLKNKHNR